MSNLKSENVNKCISLLREYLAETPAAKKKGSAVLALNQLQRITAGTIDTTVYSGDSCDGKPRANG